MAQCEPVPGNPATNPMYFPMNSVYPSHLQPYYVKAINRLGRRMQRSGYSIPKLLPESCIDRARKRTGMTDFGDEAFRLGLEKLCESLNEEAALSQLGRAAAYFNIVDSLCARLRILDYRKARPEIAREVVKGPLIILGLPRTGTTILYELLAQDPAHRSPVSWEVARPIPPAQEDSYLSDKRIRSVGFLMSLAEKLSPGLQSVHAIGAQLPQECVYMLASNFISEQFGFMYNVPGYRDWALQQDMTSAYRWHATFLQHMQVDFRRERWVLKTPPHMAYLQYLLAQYPDASLVWTHREPLTAVTSFASLASTLRGGYSDKIDPIAIGQYEAVHCFKMLEQGVSQRNRLDTGQFFDVGFEEICRDPMAVIRSIYAYFGFDLGNEAEARMCQYLDSRPRHLFGEHRYEQTDFGLSDQSYHGLFADYRRRFEKYLN